MRSGWLTSLAISVVGVTSVVFLGPAIPSGADSPTGDSSTPDAELVGSGSIELGAEASPAEEAHEHHRETREQRQERERIGPLLAQLFSGPDAFVAAGDGFARRPSEPSQWHVIRELSAAFPRDGAGAIRLASGSFAIAIQEIGATGTASLRGQSLVYQRPRGESIWTAVGAGFEEWLLIDDPRLNTVVTWEISGATLRQSGDSVEVVRGPLDHPTAVFVVSAGRAIGSSGAEIPVTLTGSGSTLTLALDASAAGERRVLVDPTWNAFGQPKLRYSNNEGMALGTATSLPTGEVLLNGGLGLSGNGPPEIFDPRSGLVRNAHSMNLNRSTAIAVLLRTGKVLVAGGFAFFPPAVGNQTNTSEVYDPRLDQWTKVAPELEPDGRSIATGTLLGTGRVLVTGGIDSSFNTYPNAEVYDPNSNAWTLTPATNVHRLYHTATLLPSGRVLVTGGWGNWTPPNNYGTATAEVYDEGANAWTSVAPMLHARYDHTATLLADGRVFVAGGRTGSNNHPTMLASTEIYDPAANTWTAGPDMALPRSEHSATLLPSGKVLLSGGIDATGPDLVTEIFDPTTSTLAPAGSLVESILTAPTTLLPDGRVLMVGLHELELHDGASGSWTPTGSPPPRIYHTSTLLPFFGIFAGPGEPAVLVAGGEGPTGKALPDCWIYTGGPNPGPVEPLNIARLGHTATLLQNGNVLIEGGLSASGYGPFSAEIYNTSLMFPKTIGTPAVARAQHTATLLPDGTVLLVGGQNGSQALASVELYIPGPPGSPGTFQLGTSLHQARARHAATLVNTPSGPKVLVTGGTSDGLNALASAELYDPATQVWSQATMFVTRSDHTSTLLPNGDVLIAGGFDSSGAGLDEAEVYDPIANVFFQTGTPLVSVRGNHSACLLVNGKVLLVGGGKSYLGTSVVDSDELYDPVLDTFTEEPMPGPRRGSTAVVCPWNQALVVGGWDGVNILGTAIQYDEGRHAVAVPQLFTVFLEPMGAVQFNGAFQATAETTGGTSWTSGSSSPIFTFDREDNEARTYEPYDDWVEFTGGSSVQAVLGTNPAPVKGWQWVRVIQNGSPSAAIPLLGP